MAVKFNLDAGWVGSPLKRAKFPNALGLIEPNAEGLQDSYADIIRNLGARSRSLSLGRPAAATAASPRFSLLSLSKDPSQEPLLDSALANLGRRSGANNALLGRFNTSLDRTLGTNEADIGQESAAVNDVFTGKLGDSIRAATAGYRTSTDATNAADAAALKAIRDAYGTDQSSAIKALYANLGKQRAGFEARTSGDIASEVARRNADAANFATAARVAADQSIADATRENKAQFGQEGGGGGSYAQRLGMGQRIRANTALAQALAELRMQNTEKELARRADLTDRVTGLERGDIAGEGQAGLGLTSDLNQQDYRNLAATLGRRQQIEDTVGARDLAAIQYEQAQKAGLLGARAGLRRSSLADILSGLNANQAFDSNELRNLALLGETRRANRFLGIDDGTGDALRFPRIPNFSRGGPVYPDLGGPPMYDVQPDGTSVPASGGMLPGENALMYYRRTGRFPYSGVNPDGTSLDQPGRDYFTDSNVVITPEIQAALERRTFSLD